jgi:ubiquitin-protein ligase E3 D
VHQYSVFNLEISTTKHKTEIIFASTVQEDRGMSSPETAAPTCPATDPSHSIYLYAELLPNIRQLPLHVSLPGASELGVDENDFSWDIQLSDSRCAITVSYIHPHFGKVAETLKLPVRVNEASHNSLRAPSGRRVGTEASGNYPNSLRNEFFFRLPADSVENCVKDTLSDDYIPWVAADMVSCTALGCRLCGSVFLDLGISQVANTHLHQSTLTEWIWKDLPSENWAEMMDFWHCHKPDTHEHNHRQEQGKQAEDKNDLIKGYGAANQIMATSKTVLVDVASFLVAEADCTRLRKKVRTLLQFPNEFYILQLLPSTLFYMVRHSIVYCILNFLVFFFFITTFHQFWA